MMNIIRIPFKANNFSRISRIVKWFQYDRNINTDNPVGRKVPIHRRISAAGRWEAIWSRQNDGMDEREKEKKTLILIATKAISMRIRSKPTFYLLSRDTALSRGRIRVCVPKSFLYSGWDVPS